MASDLQQLVALQALRNAAICLSVFPACPSDLLCLHCVLLAKRENSWPLMDGAAQV